MKGVAPGNPPPLTTAMMVLVSQSQGPAESVALVKAAADFLCYRSTSRDTRESLRGELLEKLRIFWPSLDVYIGNTHFRVFLDGKRHGADSVYIEWAD